MAVDRKNGDHLRMKKTVRIAIWFVIALVLIETASGRDVMERPEFLVPTVPGERGGDERLPDAAPIGVLPSLYLEMAYHNHVFNDGRYDSFQIRNAAHAGLVEVARFRLGLYYGTFLFSGPVDDPSRQGSDLAPWLMNAVQFEYGITGTATIAEGDGALLVVTDYSRRSYHPFRAGFAEPAADILRGGVALRELPIGSGSFDGALRARWAKLFPFWGSDIPDPSVTWSVQSAIEYRHPVLATDYLEMRLFGLGMVDVLLGGRYGIENEVELQGGLQFRSVGETERRLDLFLDLYRSPDTEERLDATTPVTLAGIGGRLVFTF